MIEDYYNYKSPITSDIEPDIWGDKMDPSYVLDNAKLNTDPEWLRAHRADYLSRLKAEIQKSGIIDPIVVEFSERGIPYVSNGVHRLIVAKELGMEVPVLYVNKPVVYAGSVRDRLAGDKPRRKVRYITGVKGGSVRGSGAGAGTGGLSTTR